jgi:ribose transport system permease protein
MSTVDSFAASVRRFSPRLLLSELLLKQWFEPVIPFTVMIGLWLYFALTIPDYASLQNTLSLLRLFAEFGFVALAMGFCLISGGIDLSVGAIFALCNFAALYFLLVREWPVGLVIAATLGVGAMLGSINGLLIGFLKTRPFLTTLVTLIILRASVNLLNTSYAQVFATNSVDSDAWDYLGGGSLFGVPINAATLFVVLLVCHIFLSRSRYGWHLTAIGASRKAARHAGIRVRLMLFATYVLSGTLCAASGIFYAARQSSTDSTTGVGWEFQALTAVVLGGVSLAGGKGTVWRAMIGALIIFLLINGLVRMGIPGYVTSAVTGIILLAAVGIDVKWSKNRGKAIQKIYVNPAFVALSSAPSVQPGSGSPYAQNDRLINAQAIGLDQVRAPRMSFSIARTGFTAAPATAMSSAFPDPTTRSARSSPISAAGRSACSSTVTKIWWWRWPAWASMASRRMAVSSRSPMRQTAPGTSSTTIPACAWLMISTSRPTARSISATAPRAMR